MLTAPASAACGRTAPSKNLEWFRDRIFASVKNCTAEDCNAPEFKDGQWSIEATAIGDNSVHLLFNVKPIFETAVRDVDVCGRHETPAETIVSDIQVEFTGFIVNSFGVTSAVGPYSHGKWQVLLERLLRGMFARQIVEHLNESR